MDWLPEYHRVKIAADCSESLSMGALHDDSRIMLTFEETFSRTLVQNLNLLAEQIKQVVGVQSVITHLDPHHFQQIVIYKHAFVENLDLLRRISNVLRSSIKAPALAPGSCTQLVLPFDPVAPDADQNSACRVTVEAVQSRLKIRSMNGSMNHHWDEHQAVRTFARMDLVGAVLVIVLIAIFVVDPSPGMYVLIATGCVSSLVLISRIPRQSLGPSETELLQQSREPRARLAAVV